MSNQSEIEKVILEIEKFIPSNNNINFILVLLRILPIFLICHDWNIHYKHSITYFISYYTTLPQICSYTLEIRSLSHVDSSAIFLAILTHSESSV